MQHQWYCPQCGHLANGAPLEDQAEWRAGMSQYGFDIGTGLDRCGITAHPLFHTFRDDPTHKAPMLRGALQHLQQQGAELQASGMLLDRASFWLRQLKEQYPQARMTLHALTSACLWVAAREYNQMLVAEPCLQQPKIQRSVSILDQFRLTFQPSAMDEHHPVARAASTTPLRAVTPMTLLDRWLNDLPGFSPEGRRLALFIAMRIERYKLIVDHLPPAIAASILWFVCYQLQEPRALTKPMLSSYARVTVVTMNMCLRKMELKRRWFFPDRHFAFRPRRGYQSTSRPLVA
jgi:transcription initiation factor TFIIIB Brf1 subunit/transcription initiation factor TFIIB